MLVLTRKKGERVFIGDDIVVTVIDVRGDGVRIGFDAPRGIPIQRAEVVAAVTAANEDAMATASSSADLLVGLISGAAKKEPAAAAAPVSSVAAKRAADAPDAPRSAPDAPGTAASASSPAPKPSTLAKPKPPTA